MSPVKHSFAMAKDEVKLKETPNFVALVNMLVRYQRRGVIRVIEMRYSKILCQGSRSNQL